MGAMTMRVGNSAGLNSRSTGKVAGQAGINIKEAVGQYGLRGDIEYRGGGGSVRSVTLLQPISAKSIAS